MGRILFCMSFILARSYQIKLRKNKIKFHLLNFLLHLIYSFMDLWIYGFMQCQATHSISYQSGCAALYFILHLPGIQFYFIYFFLLQCVFSNASKIPNVNNFGGLLFLFVSSDPRIYSRKAVYLKYMTFQVEYTHQFSCSTFKIFIVNRATISTFACHPEHVSLLCASKEEKRVIAVHYCFFSQKMLLLQTLFRLFFTSVNFSLTIQMRLLLNS